MERYPLATENVLWHLEMGKLPKENNLILRTVVIKLVLIVFVFFEPMKSLARNVICHLVRVYPLAMENVLWHLEMGKLPKKTI